MAFEKIEKTKVEDEFVGRDCPDCGSKLLYRYSRRNRDRFIGCSNYPTCKHIESTEKPKLLDKPCPDCGKELVERRSKRRNSKPFVGCTGYPNCKYVEYDNDKSASNPETPESESTTSTKKKSTSTKKSTKKSSTKTEEDAE